MPWIDSLSGVTRYWPANYSRRMSVGPNENSHDVLRERRRLISLAYRMLGSLADSEDAVQEAYVRWYRLDEDRRAEIMNPQGWLTTVTSRICLDMLGSARSRREQYVGQWLPEPVPGALFLGTANRGSDPSDRIALDDAVSTALLTVLESMTPAERVAFVLHEVFAIPFSEVATIVGRSPEAARQLASSARRHVRRDPSVFTPTADHDAVVEAFGAACRGGDLSALVALLDSDVVLRSDGGGVVRAARHPVRGASDVARFLLGVLAKRPGVSVVEVTTTDGLGYAVTLDEQILGVVNLGVLDGRVIHVWVMLNPAKLSAWRPERSSSPTAPPPPGRGQQRDCLESGRDPGSGS